MCCTKPPNSPGKDAPHRLVDGHAGVNNKLFFHSLPWAYRPTTFAFANARQPHCQCKMPLLHGFNGATRSALFPLGQHAALGTCL